MTQERVTALVPVDLLEARIAEERKDRAVLTMRLIKYREALEEHGIEPPDDTEDELLEMWRDCRAVMTTASEFVTRMGTRKEWLA